MSYLGSYLTTTVTIYDTGENVMTTLVFNNVGQTF